ncbi:11548_t:CDS:2, partial [Ambispora leptoticha]
LELRFLFLVLAPMALGLLIAYGREEELLEENKDYLDGRKTRGDEPALDLDNYQRVRGAIARISFSEIVFEEAIPIDQEFLPREQHDFRDLVKSLKGRKDAEEKKEKGDNEGVLEIVKDKKEGEDDPHYSALEEKINPSQRNWDDFMIDEPGIHPAVIISNNQQNLYSPLITIIPLTSQLDKVYPFEVLTEINRQKGKTLTDQITTIDKKRLGKYLGQLDKSVMKEIQEALHLTLAFDE